jgi:V8-like Glu-specific endopeptidase
VEKVIIGTGLIPSAREGGPRGEQGAYNEERPCGGRDNRSISAIKYVGRLRLAMCTVFLLNNNLLASAGHCFQRDSESQQVEFNVPLSSPAGIPNFAHDKDVYPVRSKSLRCSNCKDGQDLGPGKDWAIFRTGRNTVTKLQAWERQGSGVRVTNADVVAGEKIERVRVTGYGWNDHPLTAMYAQATAIGGLVGRKAVGAGGELVVEHMVDTQPGDSGAPIIVIKDDKSDTEFVIGIHFGGRCNAQSGELNVGTGFASLALQQARAEVEQESPD